jgi:hypothetical protein
MKRTIALAAAWTGSAAAAVGLGFLAVSFVDASASPGTQPVGASIPSATSSASPGGSVVPPPPGGPGPASSTAEHVTAGGTVYADCTSGAPVVAAVPAAGWRVDPSDDPGKVEFDRAGEEVEVRVWCAGGSASFAGNDAPSPASGSPARPTSGSDDSSGHGSDDGPGQESSGHGGSDHD